MDASPRPGRSRPRGRRADPIPESDRVRDRGRRRADNQRRGGRSHPDGRREKDSPSIRDQWIPELLEPEFGSIRPWEMEKFSLFEVQDLIRHVEAVLKARKARADAAKKRAGK